MYTKYHHWCSYKHKCRATGETMDMTAWQKYTAPKTATPTEYQSWSHSKNQQDYEMWKEFTKFIHELDKIVDCYKCKDLEHFSAWPVYDRNVCSELCDWFDLGIGYNHHDKSVSWYVNGCEVLCHPVHARFPEQYRLLESGLPEKKKQKHGRKFQVIFATTSLLDGALPANYDRHRTKGDNINMTALLQLKQASAYHQVYADKHGEWPIVDAKETFAVQTPDPAYRFFGQGAILRVQGLCVKHCDNDESKCSFTKEKCLSSSTLSCSCSSSSSSSSSSCSSSSSSSTSTLELGSGSSSSHSHHKKHHGKHHKKHGKSTVNVLELSHSDCSDCESSYEGKKFKAGGKKTKYLQDESCSSLNLPSSSSGSSSGDSTVNILDAKCHDKKCKKTKYLNDDSDSSIF